MVWRRGEGGEGVKGREEGDRVGLRFDKGIGRGWVMRD